MHTGSTPATRPLSRLTRRFFALPGLLLLAATLVACGGGDGSAATGTAGSGAPGAGGSGAGGAGARAGAGGGDLPAWTVLVYANGDNNLGASLFRDLVEMASADLGPDVGVYVYADYPGGERIPDSTDAFPSGSELLHIIGRGDLESLGDRAEEDFDNPNVLAAAIRLTFAAHPAQRYGLILWDHGGAWRFGFGGDRQNGTRGGRPMPIESAAAAIRAGIRDLPGRPALDFLSFDACLLGSPEVAASLTDTTKVFIANAEIDYGDGWDYDAVLSWLAAHPTASAVEFAQAEVAAWDAHHVSSLEDQLFKSHMALDTSTLNGFVTATSALVTAARSGAGATSVARAFDLALPDYFIQSTADESGSPIPLKDVGQILAALAQDPRPAIASAAAAAQAALSRVVLARALGSARTAQAGLNIGAGIPIDFTAPMSALYRDLAPTWNASSHWADLIDFVRGGADAAGPTVSAGTLADNSVPFSIADADLLSIDVQAWRVSTDRSALILLQLLERSYTGPGAFHYDWSGQLLGIDATPAPVLITLLPWREITTANGVEIPIARTIGLLQVGNSSYYTELLIDAETLRAEAAVVTVNGLPNVFPISALSGPDVMFLPLFAYVDIATGETDVTTGPEMVTIDGDAVQFTAMTPEAGSYALSIEPKDTWGNASFELFPFNLP